MRTTLDIPESLFTEALALTKLKTKTDLIKVALENIIQREKIKGIKNYYGKVDLDINIDAIRKR
jgi:hypothetical protein